MAVTGNYYHLYVANAASNNVVHFAIATNGVLTAKDTITLAAAPVAVAVNAASTYLYVVSGTTSATLTEYPISIQTGAIGAPTAQIPLTVPAYPGDTIVPTAVDVLANNNAVYVAAYDSSAYNPGGTPTSAANPGWVFGFAVGSGGGLTATSGSPYKAGVKPSAITSDPVNRFVYVTDFASNQLIGYAIQSDGSLNFLVNGPFKTGNQPTGVVVDPRGIYIYVSNSLDSDISGYTIALPTGTPSAVVNTTSNAPVRHRYPTGRHHRRSRARPLRLHRQPPGQFGLRLPAQSQHRRRGSDPGNPLSNSCKSDCDRDRASWKPLRAVGHSVVETTPQQQKPSLPGWAFCLRAILCLVRGHRRHFRSIPGELKLENPCPRSRRRRLELPSLRRLHRRLGKILARSFRVESRAGNIAGRVHRHPHPHFELAMD